jgi:hypothetical protein
MGKSVTLEFQNFQPKKNKKNALLLSYISYLISISYLCH